MHLGMECIRGPSGEEKARLGLIFVFCKFWVEEPSFVLCKETRVVIKIFFCIINTFRQVFQVRVAFVIIRLIYVDFIVC